MLHDDVKAKILALRPGAVLAPPLWGLVGARVSKRENYVTGKSMSVICINMQFLT